MTLVIFRLLFHFAPAYAEIYVAIRIFVLFPVIALPAQFHNDFPYLLKKMFPIKFFAYG